MTSGDDRQYNNRCLYVLTGPCNHEQVATVMSRLVLDFERITGNKCFYDINLPVAYDGKPRQCAYIYLSNPEFYHVILGKNPDGSERIEYYDDPEWICPEREEKSFNNWADELEEEDKYICPQLTRVLPPLLEVPNVQLNASQIAWMADTYPAQDPSIFTVVFESAFVLPVNPPYVHNKIVCGGIEPWMTDADIRRIFGKYSTSKNKKDFPRLDRFSNRAIITYDPKTTDGQYAMIMARKRHINFEGKTANIFCNFFTTDKSSFKQNFNPKNKILQENKLQTSV